jgi:hypothetical protein
LIERKSLVPCGDRIVEEQSTVNELVPGRGKYDGPGIILGRVIVKNELKTMHLISDTNTDCAFSPDCWTILLLKDMSSGERA